MRPLKCCWRAIQGGQIVRAVWNGLLKTLLGLLGMFLLCACIWSVIYIILLPFKGHFDPLHLERKNVFSSTLGA